MRNRYGAGAFVLLMALGGELGALTAPTKRGGSLASLPGPGQVRPPTLVGTDGRGISVALAATGPNAAVAYVCDGTGRTGAWFSGPVDATGAADLTSEDGAARLTYSVRNGAGALTIGGATSTLALHDAAGVAGLYRQTSARGGKHFVGGWILRNDGVLVGQATVDGKPVVAVAEDVSGPPPGDPAGATPDPLEPTPRAFLKGVRCAIIDFRFGFNNQQGLDAANAGDADALADAKADGRVLTALSKRLKCSQ
jgi:hypothetical protein